MKKMYIILRSSLLVLLIILESYCSNGQNLTLQDSLRSKKVHWGFQVNGGKSFMTPLSTSTSQGWGYDVGLFLESRGLRWHSQIELNFRSVSLNSQETFISLIDPGYYLAGASINYNYNRKFIGLDYLVKYKPRILNNKMEFYFGPELSFLIHKKLYNSQLSSDGTPYYPNYFSYTEPLLIGFKTGFGIFISKSIQWKLGLDKTLNSFGILSRNDQIQYYHNYSVPYDDRAFGKFLTLSTGISYTFRR